MVLSGHGQRDVLQDAVQHQLDQFVLGGDVGGRDPEARTAWAEALDLLDRQGRADDATRVRGQIEALDRATADQ